MLGIIGCILGFLLVIILVYKNWSVYIATVLGACVVMLFTGSDFVTGLLDPDTGYVSGIYTAIKGFFFMLVFGSILSRIYTESGAANRIADTLMNLLFKEDSSDTRKYLAVLSVVTVFGGLLSMGGIIAGCQPLLMYPIMLAMFERCDIPKKYILGILGIGAYSYSLTLPGSPEVTNVAAMTVLGTSSTVAAIPGIVGAIAEIIVAFVIMIKIMRRAKARGEHFEYHPEDPRHDSTIPMPNIVVSLIPIVMLFVLFNAFHLDVNVCLAINIILALILFWPQLRRKNIKELLSSGAEAGVPMCLTVGAICGFAAIVTNTEAFQAMIDGICSISLPPIILCAIVVAVMCMMTGGSSTGQLIALPIIAPRLVEMGLPVGVIHRVSCFAATTLDSMPYCGSILMLLPMAKLKLSEAYPALFVTTVIANTVGTIVVMLMCALFPGLAAIG